MAFGSGSERKNKWNSKQTFGSVITEGRNLWVVYRGVNGFVGHEMILECRKVHEEAGISENDIAKRFLPAAAKKGYYY